MMTNFKNFTKMGIMTIMIIFNHIFMNGNKKLTLMLKIKKIFFLNLLFIVKIPLHQKRKIQILLVLILIIITKIKILWLLTIFRKKRTNFKKMIKNKILI